MGDGNFGCNANFCQLLSRYIGETVTIFTKSGGQSGSGFTGVVLGVNECFVRLITRIGPAPGCSLGNACGFGDSGYGGYGMDGYDNYGYGSNVNSNFGGCGGYTPVYNVGSVTDIPLNSIASFVHNAV